ncbi:PAS domain-containing protein [Halarchaeum sp. CBA1220]|uniref:sensor histidine kinase n=1 Tax=Halarchaeum sp. CBA1220 TaxID=1853682 RepID=UPI000F3AA044|nr:PAS domain-containing sensor histidine kinase [Halarchaeum sp. CBA1220]QLC33884.1 PAS domain-containing protein [Halarchaeum sp. CBA1220]
MDIPHAVAAGALDAAGDALAVLNADGVVVAGNDEWASFAHFGAAADAGTDYVSAVAATDAAGARVADALRAVLDGEESAHVEYERAADGTRRWYRFRAAAFDADGERHVRAEHADVTEQVVAETAVRERDEALWSSAAVLNHDLRNRLTVASGWLDMLPDDEGDGPNPKERVANAIDRADATVVDAVEFLRVGRAGIAGEPVDVAALARAAWSDAESASATLDVRDPVTATGDAALVRDALGRVFENALAHAGPDVSVTVDAFDRGGESGFYVADDGPGIEPEKRERVLRLGGTTVEGGTGYGLPVVARIAARQGWRVAVTDAADGGTRVEFVTDPRAPQVRGELSDPRLSER